MSYTNRRTSTTVSVLLWTVQGLLCLLFLFAGSMKLVMPAAALVAQSPLPVEFLRLIGVAEVLGALGLILPGVASIRTGLTPLAALGLVIIMVGAVVVTVATVGVAPAIVPLIVGLLSATVAYGRLRWAPQQQRVLHRPARRPELAKAA